MPSHASAFLLTASRRAATAGTRRSFTFTAAAMHMAEGNESFDDCAMLTWSLGWTGAWLPSGAPASWQHRLEITSLTFTLNWVPLPVIETCSGNSERWVWAPHSLSAGTSTTPRLSVSFLMAVIGRLLALGVVGSHSSAPSPHAVSLQPFGSHAFPIWSRVAWEAAFTVNSLCREVHRVSRRDGISAPVSGDVAASNFPVVTSGRLPQPVNRG